ncbi:MAG: hypothetical protein RR552_04505 [Oscillospiraceae bacterium]
MEKKSKKPSKKAVDKLAQISSEVSEIWSGHNKTTNTDVNGSYTGNPDDYEMPVQDADDL